MRKRELIAAYKASKRAADEQSYNEGVEAGRDWATSDVVPYIELRALAGNRAILGHSYDFDYIMELILGSDVDDGYVVRDFWESAIGDDWTESALNPEFLRGFCEGALEVWDDVSPHLV